MAAQFVNNAFITNSNFLMNYKLDLTKEFNNDIWTYASASDNDDDNQYTSDLYNHKNHIFNGKTSRSLCVFVFVFTCITIASNIYMLHLQSTER